MCLISGGIDSPVSTYIAGKYGEIILVFVDNSPYLPKGTKERVIRLCEQISKKLRKKLKLYIVQNGENIKNILKYPERRLTCILCRRIMYKIAEEVAKRENAQCIITGESLAQVASQTLHNLSVESKAIEIPILRPLLCLDKEEIVRKAKEIGTYEISCTREKGCYTESGKPACCFATPRYPETKAKKEDVENAERKLNLKIKEIVENAEILEV
ncbi:MAG: hypothetical protein QXF15_00895 [Candidatus Aenigmatarchaeota archaeon]|nr:7-cyano-7-deazaguanine synthase [Candidatus Aenigmarchaeota archaeon]